MIVANIPRVSPSLDPKTLAFPRSRSTIDDDRGPQVYTGVIGSTNHKIISIDNRRCTIILRRCNRTDRRYRPCSPVGGTEPTVDIDRDQPTGGLIGGLVSIITCVLGPFLTTCGTIDFLVDDYLGTFFITGGTIGRYVIFCSLAGYIQKLFQLNRPKDWKREGIRSDFRTVTVTKGEVTCSCV